MVMYFEKKMERLNSGDFVFGMNLNSRQRSDEMWKSRMAGGGGHKKRFQYCIDSSGQEILYLRRLQGHSGRNPIDPSLQDNVLIPDNFFDYIFHIGCVINSHSITNSGYREAGVNPMNEEHKEPYKLDLTRPCLAWYKQKTWKRRQDTVLGSIYKLLNRKDISSVRKVRTQSSFTTHSQFWYLESYSDGNWRIKYDKVYMNHLSSKNFFER